MKNQKPSVKDIFPNIDQLEINDAEQNCIDTFDHQAKIEVHFTPSEGEEGREKSKELARRIVKAVNLLSYMEGAIKDKGVYSSEELSLLKELLEQAERK